MFLVIAIRTCHTYPRPQNVESPVVDVAKETEYEEHRDAELQESINGGQSGRALLFPYNGILAIGKMMFTCLNFHHPAQQNCPA